MAHIILPSVNPIERFDGVGPARNDNDQGSFERVSETVDDVLAHANLQKMLRGNAPTIGHDQGLCFDEEIVGSGNRNVYFDD